MFRFLRFALVILVINIFCVGCKDRQSQRDPAEKPANPPTQTSSLEIADKPVVPDEQTTDVKAVKVSQDIPVAIEPDKQPELVQTTVSADIPEPKRLWAQSYLWAEAPKIEVEKWLSDAPETEGKYILLEIWTTWCSQCVRSIPDLNAWQQKYADELVVIGITNEPEETVTNFKGPKIDYYSGIDTQGRVKDQLGVKGFPHVIIIEPGGGVVWEGFPYLKDYELTGEVIEKILAVGRESKEAISDKL